MNTEIRDDLKNLDERLTVSGITSPSALNKIKGALCGVRCTSSVDTTAGTGVDKTLSWDSEDYDSDGFHSTSSNTSRITIPSGLDGYYIVTAAAEMQGNSTGDRTFWIEDNTGIVQYRQIIDSPSASSRTAFVLTGVIQLAAAEWIAVHISQDSGSTLDVYQNIIRASFSAHRLFAA